MIRIRKGVITAAGRGTRQYPASNTVQKELFPLVDVDGHAKPTVQIIVEELLGSGIDEVCIIANPANVDPMRRHFQGLPDTAPRKEWMTPLSAALADMARRLTFVVQETQNGYGHAVLQAREWVGDEPFLLTLGDHIYFSQTVDRCARQVVAAYEDQGCSVSSVAHVAEGDLYRYGTVAGTPVGESRTPLYQIAAMAEKPSVEYARAYLRTPGLPSDQYLCFFGLHAFTPILFDCLAHLVRHDLRERGEIQLTSAQALLFERERYLLCEVAGVRHDMGIPEGLIQTQIALALRSPFAAEARAMLQELRMSELIRWAQKIQALSQTGLAYARDPYDQERYETLREIAAEMLAAPLNTSAADLLAQFAREEGYATPKVDVRGVIIQDGKMLLVQERADGLWTLPGGWADVGDTPSRAVEREIREESGYEARAVKLLALYDRDKQGHPPIPFHVYKAFFRCEIVGGKPAASIETTGADFFRPTRSALSLERVTPAQIARFFAHAAHPDWPTEFD